jgi:hypothetical protein
MGVCSVSLTRRIGRCSEAWKYSLDCQGGMVRIDLPEVDCAIVVLQCDMDFSCRAVWKSAFLGSTPSIAAIAGGTE